MPLSPDVRAQVGCAQLPAELKSRKLKLIRENHVGELTVEPQYFDYTLSPLSNNIARYT